MEKKKVLIATATAVTTKPSVRIVTLIILLLGSVIAVSITVASWFASQFLR